MIARRGNRHESGHRRVLDEALARVSLKIRALQIKQRRVVKERRL